MNSSAALLATDVEAPVIVVGTGPVGMQFARNLSALRPRQRIQLFGKEPIAPYDRVRLSDLLAGRTNSQTLFQAQFSAGGAVETFNHCPVIRIHPMEQTIVDADSRYHPYSKLVIATGSTPFLPDIPGIDLKRVYTFRDIGDAEQLVARRVASQHTVVIGGGLLGVEAAAAMTRGNTQVTVVQQAPHLMNRQLDETGAEYLRRSLQEKGVRVCTGSGVRALLADDLRPEAVGGVRLRDGSTIHCDTVIVAAGIKPEVMLAREAGIAVGKGIKVGTTLRSSVPTIYAIGECAEFAGQIYGLVAPGLEQAAVAAADIAGQRALYLGSLSATNLKVAGEHVFSAGIVDGDETTLPLQAVVYEDAVNGLYRKLLVSRGQLVGALGYGRWDDTARLQNAIIAQQRVFFWQLARFSRSGSLWGVGAQAQVGQWPQGALVCNCRGVTRGRLSQAMARGCDTIEQLASETGASTVCGSCQPLLQNLVGQAATRLRVPAVRTLTGVIAVAAFLLALLMQTPPAVSTSVQATPWWELVWSDGLYKQISGFSMLGLVVLGLAVSFKKRLLTERLRSHFNYWRLWHVGMGTLAIALLILHTGFQSGDNLNQWLLYNFLALSAVGAAASMVIPIEQRLSPQLGKQLRNVSNWAHLMLSWPLPVLLSFHIISVYYF